MGVATIVGGGPDGRYTITFDIGTAARAGRVAAVTAQIAEATARIAAAQTVYDDAVVARDAALVALDAAVNAYVAATQSGTAAEANTALMEHGQALKLFIAQQATVAAKLLRLNDLKLAKAQREKELAHWNGLVLVETRDAWCVDLTEDASGQVATVEIPGESELMLIAPGGRPYVNADGVLASRALLNPPQAFFNAAILPGWQRFMPTYRWGTITALDVEADTADVSLGAAVSSAQSLNVNQSATLTGVPVEYMTCNAAAFEVGDNVVIQFVGQDWNAPKVIGFLDNPKSCSGWPCIGVRRVESDGTVNWIVAFQCLDQAQWNALIAMKDTPSVSLIPVEAEGDGIIQRPIISPSIVWTNFKCLFRNAFGDCIIGTNSLNIRELHPAIEGTIGILLVEIYTNVDMPIFYDGIEVSVSIDGDGPQFADMLTATIGLGTTITVSTPDGFKSKPAGWDTLNQYSAPTAP